MQIKLYYIIHIEIYTIKCIIHIEIFKQIKEHK